MEHNKTKKQHKEVAGVWEVVTDTAAAVVSSSFVATGNVRKLGLVCCCAVAGSPGVSILHTVILQDKNAACSLLGSLPSHWGPQCPLPPTPCISGTLNTKLYIYTPLAHF
jgi:hypothetical protein